MEISGADSATAADRAAAVDDRSMLELNHPAAYGDAFSDVYDRWYDGIGAANGGIDAMVRFVAERCPSKLLIELGVGSGRLAQPLVYGGLTVVGVDASAAMLQRCPGIVLRVGGDMALLPFRTEPESTRQYGPTVLCGFNTLFNLHSSDRLHRLLADLAEMRATFIVEFLNADILATAPDVSTGRSPRLGRDGELVISSTSIDVDRQILVGRHLQLGDSGVFSRPWMVRWITVDELDLAAERSGLTLAERYSTWDGEPFTEHSSTAIGVYRPSP